MGILDKHGFDTTILKIQKKKLNKVVNFLVEVPCFKGWTKNQISRFSRNLTKKTFKRNSIVYKAGEAANKIFLIRKGEFEVVKPLPRDLSHQTEDVVEMFGYNIN